MLNVIGGDLGLLILRLSMGSMMFFSHGLGKLLNFSTYSQTFPDPLGIGSTVSLVLCVVAEFFAPLLLSIGFASRVAALILAVNMFVAGVIIHAPDPFAKKELAFLYLTFALCLFLTGPGKYSVDSKIKG
ncbi:MAG: DoxX family protein [Oligoflexales bacterium]